MNLKTALSLSILAATACAAEASIVSTSGACIQIGPPASALPGALQASNAWAWDELGGINLVSMPVDLSTNPSTSFAPVPGFLSGQVDSHFVHFDGFPGVTVTGSVTFNQPILGVQYSDGNLDLADGVASAGTAYPTFAAGRGFFNWTGADHISINGNVLTFEMSAADPTMSLETLRVFTRAIPTPGSAMLLGLGALVGGARRRR